MSLVHNERVKLTATAVNNTAIAMIVTGMVVPVVSAFNGTLPPARPLWWVTAGAWPAGGGALHLAARHILGRLRP